MKLIAMCYYSVVKVYEWSPTKRLERLRLEAEEAQEMSDVIWLGCYPNCR
jgi:hypothetical protein